MKTVNFRMPLDDESKQRIRSLAAGYTELLARLVRETKPAHVESSELHEGYFNQFAQLLCMRDEHNAFIRNRLNHESNSVLDTPALLAYEELYHYLASSLERSPQLQKPKEDAPLTLCAATVDICRRGLHCFGTKNTKGENTETSSWKRICDTYFPTADPVEFRRAYYNYLSTNGSHSSESDFPIKWSFEEDYAVFDNVSRFGRGEMGVHYTYLALGQKRSYDDIVGRIHVIYPNQTRKYKSGKSRVSSPKSPSSTWSLDDALLVPE